MDFLLWNFTTYNNIEMCVATTFIQRSTTGGYLLENFLRAKESCGTPQISMP